MGSYPRDVLRDRAARGARAKIMEIDRTIWALRREYMQRGMDYDEFRDKLAQQAERRREVAEELRQKLH